MTERVAIFSVGLAPHPCKAYDVLLRMYWPILVHLTCKRFPTQHIGCTYYSVYILLPVESMDTLVIFSGVVL